MIGNNHLSVRYSAIYPGVNARMSAYIDFIEEATCQLSDYAPAYCDESDEIFYTPSWVATPPSDESSVGLAAAFTDESDGWNVQTPEAAFDFEQVTASNDESQTADTTFLIDSTATNAASGSDTAIGTNNASFGSFGVAFDRNDGDGNSGSEASQTPSVAPSKSPTASSETIRQVETSSSRTRLGQWMILSIAALVL